MFKKKGTSHQPLFGVHWSQGGCGPQAQEFVSTICAWLQQQENVIEEGLYRKSGDLASIAKVKAALNKSPKLLKPFLERKDAVKSEHIHIVTGLLKCFLREFPEPIFPYEFYGPCITASCCLPAYRTKMIHSIIEIIPPPNKAILRVLCHHFHVVTLYHNQNMMTSKNLAIVMAPTLLRPQTETLSTIFGDATASYGFIESLISSPNEFFDDESIPAELGAPGHDHVAALSPPEGTSNSGSISPRRAAQLERAQLEATKKQQAPSAPPTPTELNKAPSKKRSKSKGTSDIKKAPSSKEAPKSQDPVSPRGFKRVKNMFHSPAKAKKERVFKDLEEGSSATLASVQQELHSLEEQLLTLKRSRASENSPIEQQKINSEISKTTEQIKLKREQTTLIQNQVQHLSRRLSELSDEKQRPIRFSMILEANHPPPQLHSNEPANSGSPNSSSTLSSNTVSNDNSTSVHEGSPFSADATDYPAIPPIPIQSLQKKPSYRGTASPPAQNTSPRDRERQKSLKRENCATEFTPQNQDSKLIGGVKREDFEEAFESVFGAIVTFSGETLVNEGIKRAVTERGFWLAEFPNVDGLMQTWQFGAPMSLDYMNCSPRTLCPLEEELEQAMHEYDPSTSVALLMLVRLSDGTTASYWELILKEYED